MNKSLDELPEPDLKNLKISMLKPSSTKEKQVKTLHHLDLLLGKTFLKQYFEDKIPK